MWGFKVCAYQAGKQEQEMHFLVSENEVSRSYS